MVLHHIAQGPRFFVITAARPNAQALADRDLHVIDGLAVPELFENGIGKTEHQNVLNGFFAKIMVDAINLFFVSEASQLLIQLLGRCEIVAERLFHHDPLAKASGICLRQQTGLMQVLDNFGELARRGGQIKEQIAAQRFIAEGCQQLSKFFISRRV